MLLINKINSFQIAGFFASVIVGSVPKAKADIVYAVRFTNAPTTLEIGQTATLGIVLQETVTGASVHRLGAIDSLTDTLGLTSANIQVSVSGSGASVISSGTANGLDFDSATTSSANSDPFLLSNVILLNNPVVGTLAGATRTVSLGSITITGQGIAGQTNTFTLGDQGASADLIIDSFNGFSPESLILDGTLPAGSSLTFGNASITLTAAAVPEPSSLVLASFLGFGVWFRSRLARFTRLVRRFVWALKLEWSGR